MLYALFLTVWESVWGLLSPSPVEHILADRGSEFGDSEVLEVDVQRIQRFSIYYCAPMQNDRKGDIRQSHTILRVILPKCTNFEFPTQWDVNLIINHINSTPQKVPWRSPSYRATLEIFGEDTLNAFQLRPIASDEINLTPNQIRFNY